MTAPPDTPATAAPSADAHPWRRFVAVGDSFTEGIGDPDDAVPGGHRGWADRVAEVLAAQVEGFHYGNLAVRGRLIAQIVEEQIEPALALNPDLVTLCAGGNDIIRPGADPDHVSQIVEDAVSRLGAHGATVVLFTGIDVGWQPVFRSMRGRVAIYNENLRAIADRHDAIVADQWALKEIQDPRFFDDDRLHLNALGHHEVARMVLRALNVPNDLVPMEPAPSPVQTWRAARAHDLVWARSHLAPWVLRRITRQSSGDGVTPKRPEPAPVALPETLLAPGADDPAPRGERA